MKTTRVPIVVFSVLMAGMSSAFEVPLIVENKLADALQNELVIVSLAQLNVPPEEMKGWEDIAVSDGADKLVCQVDDLLENGWDDKDELSFFIDLQPHERKNLTVEFLTKKREGGDSSAEVTRIGDDLKVKNRFLSFNFSNSGSGYYGIRDIDLEGQSPALGNILMGLSLKSYDLHYHTGPVRTVLSFKGKIWKYYGERGWQLSAYEIMPVISLSEARPEIIYFAYIQAVSEPESFQIQDLNVVYLNKEDLAWRGSCPQGKNWALVANDKNEAVGIAVSSLSNLAMNRERMDEGFLHVIDMNLDRTSWHVRTRPRLESDQDHADIVKQPRFMKVHYFFYDDAPDETTIEKEFARVSAPLLLLPKLQVSEMKRSSSMDKVLETLSGHDPLIVCSESVEKKFKTDVVRLAETLGTVYSEEKDFLPFFRRQYRTWPRDETFLIIIGEPGSKLIDEFTEKYGIADVRFPGPGKERLVLVDDFLGLGRKALFVSGSGLPEVKKSLDKLLAGVKDHKVDSICGFVDIYKRNAPWINRSDSEKMILYTWRNGWSELQVLLKPEDDLSGLNVDVDLPMDARVEVTHILWEYLDLEGRKLTGFYPANDGLRPSVPRKIAKDQPVSVWISLYIPENVRPGSYKGTVQITADGFTKALPLEVNVGSLTLAAQPPISFFPMYSALHPAPNHSNLELYLDVERYTEPYYQALTNISRVLALYGADVASLSYANISGVMKGERIILDTTRLEKELAAYRRGNPNTHTYIYSEQQAHWQKMVKTIMLNTGWNEKTAFTALGREFRKAFGKLGIEDSVYAYIEDEPSDYTVWVKQAQGAKWMGLRCTTAINHCQPEKMATAVGMMDLWIPLWQRFKKPGQFSPEFHRQRKKDDNQIWLYTCAGANPRANFGLTNTQVPFLILDSWFRGAEGVMYYGGLYWSHAISRVKDGTAKDLWKAHSANNPSGSCTFYPDEKGKTIIPSQRAQVFRESFQILKALDLLQRRKGRDAIAPLMSTFFAEMDAESDSRFGTNFDGDPENYHRLKKTLFEMAEE